MTTPNLFTQMFETVQSLHFGRTFWLDEENEFCSAPTFKNGSTDWEMWDYVSEWEDLEGVDLSKLFDLHRTLVQQKTLEEARA